MRPQYEQQEERGEIPQYLVGRRADDNILIFNKRVEHDELLRTFMRDMLGVNIERTESGNLIFKKGKDSLVNEEGAKKIFVTLRGSINSITSLTQLSEEQISMMLEATCEDIAVFFYLENRNMSLGDEMVLPILCGIRNLLISQFNKSLNGFENKQISIVQQHEQHTIRQDQQKRSFLDRLTGRNKEMVQQQPGMTQ